MTELDRHTEALKMIAGVADSCGQSHSSTLHDTIKCARFALIVLSGVDPHIALEMIR